VQATPATREANERAGDRYRPDPVAVDRWYLAVAEAERAGRGANFFIHLEFLLWRIFSASEQPLWGRRVYGNVQAPDTIAGSGLPQAIAEASSPWKWRWRSGRRRITTEALRAR
jgi:hypothetical protein